MATGTDLVKTVGTGIFDAARLSQDACMTTARSWAELSQRFWSALYSPLSPKQPPSVSLAFESALGLTRRLLDLQVECARAFMDAAEPIWGLNRAGEPKQERPFSASHDGKVSEPNKIAEPALGKL